MFAVTKRLLLRPGWMEDAPALARAIADEQVVRNLARAPWPYGLDDAKRHLGAMGDAPLPVMLVTKRDDAEIVGIIGFDRLAAGDVDFGYWIARPHWNRGFATEAGLAALDIAKTLGFGAISAGHFIDNPASGRVLRKLGFRPTGERVMRHSCARGEAAEALTYALDLAQEAKQVAA